MSRLSKRQVNDLGDRLRLAATPSEADRALLNAYRDEHLPVIAGVLAVLRQLPFADAQGLGSVAFTARQKNAPTILEKLRREREMQLWRMRDIAGVRIVIHSEADSRGVQDRIVSQIQAAFPGARTIDRRGDPRSGYRAVHVEVGFGQRHAEIQVRTYFQDLWAQVFERLGDQWGRQIRYGEPPLDPDAAVTVRGVRVTRKDVLSEVQHLSAMIAQAELLQGAMVAAASKSEVGLLPAVLGAVASVATHLKVFVDLRDMFAALGEVMPSTPRPTLAFATPDLAPGERPYFLVAYRRASGRVEHCEPFAASAVDEIVARRVAMEQAHQDDPDFEVVLLASDSQQSLLQTHARYFKNARELVEE